MRISNCIGLYSNDIYPSFVISVNWGVGNRIHVVIIIVRCIWILFYLYASYQNMVIVDNIYLSLFSDCINFWVRFPDNMKLFTLLYHIQFLNYSHFAYSVIYLCIYVLRLNQIKPLYVSCRRSFSAHSMWMDTCLGWSDMIGIVFFLHSCNVHMYMRMYVTHNMHMYIR